MPNVECSELPNRGSSEDPIAIRLNGKPSHAGALVLTAILAGCLSCVGRGEGLPPLPPPPVADANAVLDQIQRTAVDYFWQEANPDNGLIRDRSRPDSKCSIAAVGFGLSALVVGMERGWVDREAGRERIRTTLRTFWTLPQGPQTEGVAGYRGWFYHFLEMDTGLRAWNCELSSIDTALLLAGVLDAELYFDGKDPIDVEIRDLAERLLGRVDWNWMRFGQPSLTMGWRPEQGFLSSRWHGYNEAMILYLLGLGVVRDPLPATSWSAWTETYEWGSQHGQEYIVFPPLFGHQYSHVWVDFRGVADDWMRLRGIDYFENSRRATLAQQAYAIENPKGHRGYGRWVWGLTACDGPVREGYRGYSARGAPPPENDDGTLAPTAVGGAVPFAPEICIPTLEHLYREYGEALWTRYGFRDAFHLGLDWYGPDVLGIDQGCMLLMIENYRTGSIWERMKRHPVFQRGLERAGFRPL